MHKILCTCFILILISSPPSSGCCNSFLLCQNELEILSLKAKFRFICLFILVLLAWQVNLLSYILFPQWQRLHLLKDEEGYPLYRQECQGFLVSAWIYLIRGWGLVYQGKSVQINFMFLPLGNNKSLSTCTYFVTALTYLYPIKNFQMLCRGDYPICMTRINFTWAITKHYHF